MQQGRHKVNEKEWIKCSNKRAATYLIVENYHYVCTVNAIKRDLTITKLPTTIAIRCYI